MVTVRCRVNRDRRSLNSMASEDNDSFVWPAFGDIALALLLVFTLFILVQFLHYDRIFILQSLEARQDTVKNSILQGIPSAQRENVSFPVPADAYHQRITFQSDLLFSPCRSTVAPDGTSLLQAIGRTLKERAHYFESVQVEGHTDIHRPLANCGVADNWALSSERATSVVRILADSLSFGQAPLLSAVGRGEYHPVGAVLSTDTTSQALARHRRIELVLQYTDRGILGEGS